MVVVGPREGSGKGRSAATAAAGVSAGGAYSGVTLESMLLDGDKKDTPLGLVAGAAAAVGAGAGVVDYTGDAVMGASGGGAEVAGGGKKLARKALAGKSPRTGTPGAGGKMGKAGALCGVKLAETKGVPKVREPCCCFRCWGLWLCECSFFCFFLLRDVVRLRNRKAF